MNNAGGITFYKPTQNYTPEDFSNVMTLNLESAFHLSQLAYPMLKASGEGSIIFISSVASLIAFDIGGAYGAAKGMQMTLFQLLVVLELMLLVNLYVLLSFICRGNKSTCKEFGL